MVLEYILFDSVYGSILVAAIAFGAMRLVATKLPIGENLIYGAAFLVFLLAVVTLPSYPSYQFAREVEEQSSDAPHMRKIEEKQSSRHLTRPLTLFFPPTIYFRYVGPRGPLEPDSFLDVHWAYGHEPLQIIYEVFCDEKELWASVPDSEGVFRMVTEYAVPMKDEDHELFCQSDWSVEKEALRQMILSQ